MIEITESDLHPHLIARMQQRGITRPEIERTLNAGWDADDTRPGTFGKVFILEYRSDWEGKFYEEKEVSVYYKMQPGHLILLTAKARYGKNFERKEKSE